MSPATTPPTSSRRRVAVLSGLAVTIALTACASDGSTVATPAPATAAPASSTTAPATSAPSTASPATTTAPSTSGPATSAPVTSAPVTTAAPATGAVTDLLPAPDGPYAVGVTVLPEFSMHGYYPAVA